MGKKRQVEDDIQDRGRDVGDIGEEDEDSKMGPFLDAFGEEVVEDVIYSDDDAEYVTTSDEDEEEKEEEEEEEDEGKETRFKQDDTEITKKKEVLAKGELEKPGIKEKKKKDKYGNDHKQAAYLPTLPLERNEVLAPDQNAYHMLHSLNVQWPYLSFDIVTDDLGWNRSHYPATVYLVGGTQADQANSNEITIMKLSSLNKTNNDLEKVDSDSESDSDSDVDVRKNDDPILEHRSLRVTSATNRISTLTPTTSPSSDSADPSVFQTARFCASMHTDGLVRIWDLSPHLQTLSQPGTGSGAASTYRPVQTLDTHREEGFALAWSPSTSTSASAPQLVTGDNSGSIFLHRATQSGFVADKAPFKGHTNSVEDLGFSPTEPTVFMSCSSDGTVKVWDSRLTPRKAALDFRGHAVQGVDINVLSWSRKVSYLLATGADDGEFRVWDLRSFKNAAAGALDSVARFKWHSSYISSIEWCPTEESVLAVAGGDNQVTLWDMSVEEDDEETKGINGKAGLEGVPNQLLFVHQGQSEVKEVKWHPQIPGVAVSSASEGFNRKFKYTFLILLLITPLVFKTISI